MTAIEELPASIEYLPELYRLDLSSCTSLRKLPNSLLKLPNLMDLELANIDPLGRESLKKVMQQSEPDNISCENIESLNLNNLGLLDEDLHLALKCFQNVQDLILSKNDFVSLPECIKECAYLERLVVNNCKRLRDIPELPSTLQDIAAENCTSLTTESIGRLWSQAKDGFRVAIITPATTTFPDWFDLCCKSGKLSFRVRGNFPRVLITYETGKATSTSSSGGIYSLEVFMRINGHKKMPWMIQSDREARQKGRVLSSFGNQCHAYFFDLLSHFSEEELKGLNRFLGLDYWNDVEIQVMCDSSDISIVKCGIYVDKQQTNMKNIVQFKSSDMISMNASSRTSLKRRMVASLHPNEPPKKHLRRFQEKINCTKRRTK